MFKVRKSNERGHGDFGWLNAKYSFSFANYYDPNHMGWGDLLVINEDKIAGAKGFGSHPHKDMEIITYVIDGALEHKDSMGNEGVIRPGDIQYMSAGTGVVHSEFNHLQDRESHILQIWILPDSNGHLPNYGQATFKDRLKENELCLIVSGDGRDESIKINQDLSFYTARLSAGHNIDHEFKDNRRGWIQLAKGRLVVNGQNLDAGDGLAVEGISSLNMEASQDSEFLLFDLR